MAKRALLLFVCCSFALSGADFGVRVILGLSDTGPVRWDGSCSARGATIASIEPWRFDGDDAMGPANSWKISTHPIRLFGGGRGGVRPPIVANGVILWLTDASDSAEIAVQTAQGNFTVRASEIPYGKQVFALEKRVMVDRVPPVTRLAESADEQDYPAAAAAPNGDLWVAYLEFRHHPEHDRLRANLSEPPKNMSDYALAPGGDQIFVKRSAGGKWAAPIAVTKGGEDLYRPAVAIDGTGRPWVFWSSNEKGNFDLVACVIDNGRPGKALRLSSAAGSDIDPAAATDSKGRVWVAWQAWRNGKAEIHYAAQQGDAFSAEAVVAASSGNEWNPSIAAGADGRVTVAWDSYRNGNYDIYLRTARPNGSWDAERALANSARYEAYPSLAYAPGGRLWIAYEEGSERWGKDWGAEESSGVALYQGRAIRLVGVEPDGRLVRPRVDPGSVLPGLPSRSAELAARQAELTEWLTPKPDAWKNRNRSAATQAQPAPKNSYPRVAADRSGRIWLAARSAHPIWWNPLGSVWSEYVLSYDGGEWTGPVWLSHSDNLLDNRPALVSTAAGELAVIGSSDGRRHFYLSQLTRRPGAPGIPMMTKDPYNNDLYLNRISLPPATTAAAVEAASPLPAAKPLADDDIETKGIAAMRAARVHGRYRIARGEFHRHSEISMDGGNDGSIREQWRYILDAANMDWAGCCDHDNGGGREYSWWISQKLTDIFHAPGQFVPMFSYERSVPYPEGHRNTVFEQRGIRPLPRLPITKPEPRQSAPDTQMFYTYLKKFNGIVASHTSGTNMGTDWRDHDPQAEPVVEIYQGERQNYERPDAPRSNSEQDSIGGWRPLGFINLALEMGYKMAFQSSSDHISTHMSYCNVLTPDLSRKSILDAFQKRHVYGATDNILAEFSAGEQIMGDAFTAASAPEFSIRLVGTAPFRKVHIIKDNKYVYTTEPGTGAVQFRWRDAAAEMGKTSYYYVRGEQQDGEVVWVSPMWVTYQR
jgi:hypothetical protein